MACPERRGHAIACPYYLKISMNTIEVSADKLKHPEEIMPRKLDTLPVVGLGGSAGAIQALQEFFKAMPVESGMAFVVILHLSPDYESELSTLLQRSTQMPVIQVTKTAKVLPNHVYVIPQGHNLALLDGHVRLTELQKRGRGKHVEVDLFFRSLAEAHGTNAIAIVLSGADGDGAIGIKRVKELGGLTIAQEPGEAEHDSMPRSAIATGMVDWVLPVAQIPGKLLAYRENAGRIQLPDENPAVLPKPEKLSDEHNEAALREVLNFLRTRTGHDFNAYKRATVLRRVGRRMQINGVENLPTYLEFLRTHPGEAGALMQDLLISVTNFFRDAEAFAELEAAIPQLFQGKTSDDQVRVWVCACATGEEAYSVAMMLREHAEKMDAPPSIQVFASDLDEPAIRAAREGLYPTTIAADVSEERLLRFFSLGHGCYRVRREIREIVLFAEHNLLKDAPFSRLDLVTCRNLLIYFNREAQNRAFEIFHFALRHDGLLFLGPSESTEEATELFQPISKKHRLYAPRPAARGGVPLGFSAQAPRVRREAPVLPALNPPEASPALEVPANFWGEFHLRMLEDYAPPSLIVNDQQEIVHMSEHVGRFLHFAGGQPSRNLLDVVNPALRLELRTALFRAQQENASVQVRQVPLEIEEKPCFVHISVRPMNEGAARGGFLVVFEEQEREPSIVLSGPDSLARDLEEELQQVKSNLRSTIEQYEASTEELKASNEELQAMNEELRSATEELETNKEELQSLNEELTTVNQEMKSKVEELSHSNSDLKNLMASTNIATIFLDRALCIQRYTPPAVELFNLIPTDIDRPLSDLRHRLDYDGLQNDAAQVLQRLLPVEREIHNADGRCFLARFTPYRSDEDRIGGVVLTLVDITERKRSEQERLRLHTHIEQQAQVFNTTLSSINDFAYIFDKEGRFVYSNKPLLDLLGITLEQIIGKNFFDLNYPHDLAARLQSQIRQVFETGEMVKGETPFTSPTGADGFYEYIFNPVKAADGSIESVAGSTRDVTGRKRLESNLEFLAEISQDLTTLSGIDEIMRMVGTKIGAYLDLSNCALIEVNETEDAAVVNHGWHRPDAPELRGVYRISEYLSEEFQRAGRAGENFIINDTQNDLRADAAAYARIKIGSFLGVPVIEDGEWRFMLIVYKDMAHVWRADEIELMNDLTKRVWTRLERARADELLRESEEKFRRLVDVTSDVVYQISADWRELRSLNGKDFIHSTSEANESWLEEYIPESDRRRVSDDIEKAIQTRTIYESEHRVNRLDGSIGWAFSRAVPVLDETGEIVEWLGAASDITERKQAEEALRESEARFRTVADSVPQLIWTNEPGGKANYFNRRWFEYSGLSYEESFGVGWQAMVHPDDAPASVPEWQAALEAGEIFDTEYRLRRSDGAYRWHIGRNVPIRDAQGRIGGWFGTATDIEDLKEAENALREAHDELETRVEQRTAELARTNQNLQAEAARRQAVEKERVQLLQRVVTVQEEERRRISRDLHDSMGQQLTALLMGLQTLPEWPEPGPRSPSYPQQLEKLRVMATGLLEHAQQLAWEVRPAALDNLGLEATLQQHIEEWGQQSGIAVGFVAQGFAQAPRAPEPVETALYRVIQEALTNVLRHAQATQVSVVLERNGHTISAIIEDNGRGFEAAGQESDDRAPSRRLGIMGMIERMELIGGTLLVESEAGQGTTIYARVPIKLQESG